MVGAPLPGEPALPEALHWRGFGEALSRIWHGTHEVRRILNATRTL